MLLRQHFYFSETERSGCSASEVHPSRRCTAHFFAKGVPDWGCRVSFFSVRFLIHYAEYDILPFGSWSKRRATSEREQKT